MRLFEFGQLSNLSEKYLATVLSDYTTFNVVSVCLVSFGNISNRFRIDLELAIRVMVYYSEFSFFQKYKKKLRDV